MICEKPLLGSIAEVDDGGTRRQGANGPKLMPIFQYRYGSGSPVKPKMLIDLGPTGEAFPTTIETYWWRGPIITRCPGAANGRANPAAGLLGHAIHAHDMLNYIHGPCAELFSFGATLVNPIGRSRHSGAFGQDEEWIARQPVDDTRLPARGDLAPALSASVTCGRESIT